MFKLLGVQEEPYQPGCTIGLEFSITDSTGKLLWFGTDKKRAGEVMARLRELKHDHATLYGPQGKVIDTTTKDKQHE